MSEEKKEYKFCLEVRKDEGYVIEWTSDDKNIGDFKPVLDCITYYNEEKGDDVMLFPVSNDLEFEVSDCKDGQFEITVLGTVTIALAQVEIDALEAVDFRVDWPLNIRDSEGEGADDGREYDSIESQAAYLELLED